MCNYNMMGDNKVTMDITLWGRGCQALIQALHDLRLVGISKKSVLRQKWLILPLQIKRGDYARKSRILIGCEPMKAGQNKTI